MRQLKLLLIFSVMLFPISGSTASPENPMLGYTTYGNGPEKVIVLHDWMGDAANYEMLLPYLDANTFTWVFPDVRGYGRSLQLKGKYTVTEISADVFRLAKNLGWERFHVVGHSMNGMTVQRMLLDDWTSGRKLLKSAVAITPVTADGYPADEGTKKFLWDAIHNRNISEQAFAGLTGKRLLSAWGRIKTTRNLATSTKEAMQGYYTMWLETDFSEELILAKVKTPLRVIGGRQDLPGFQEAKYNKSFSVWFPTVDMKYITDSGHYPMHETPVLLATLMEEFIRTYK